ncbi:glutamine synthetase family protein [Nitratireductor sp. XY-223]|uniref:glutamine synthetase family protein n=1 Tax=Nitratireductor sp. XY-223 TaxID=2561926 RepID=UPI001FEF055F|nr:glutamine synthetase family protein [Nitratireductor sp. XY-223]
MSGAAFTLPEGTHTVAMGLGDLNGIMRGKRIPSTHWDHICKSGNALSIALFAIDMTCDVWDTPYVNFDNGYPDMHMFPITQPVPLPWEPGVAFCLARAEGMDHKPVPIDPRNALVSQVERAKGMGFEVNVGTELEFHLLDPETRQPRDQGIQVYSLARAAELEHVLGPIRQQINEAGIPIEQSNPEYAPGQVEVNIRYGGALQAADRVVMFRSLVKQLATVHGYLATFMAKPFIDQSGNGFHTHYSLWREGGNAFSDGGKLSAVGRNFVAGLQKRMAETALCGATTPNAYRRRQPYTFCPINTSWGIDNRTVGIRIIEGNESAVRAEKRDASADCNPYLLIAAELAAGLDGIEQGLEPSEMATGNAYEEADADPIPTDIREAVQQARGSEFMKSVFGDDMFELLVQQAEREIGFFDEQVTQVELDRYIENF